MCRLFCGRSQFHCEMAHQLAFPNDLHTACDFVAAVKYVFEGNCDYSHVIVRVHTARNSQTEQVEATEAVFSCHGITVGKDITDLASADTGLTVKFHRQCLGRELFFGNVGKDLAGIDEDRMATCGTLVGNAVLIEQ